MLQVTLGMPIHARPETAFLASLLDLIFATTAARPDIKLRRSIARGTDICANREQIVREAIEAGSSHLLFLDSDQVFAPEALLKLLSRDLDVVGCNYRRRQPPHHPTANVGGELVVSTKERAAASPVELAHWLGLGLCLVRMAALDALEPEGLFPLFLNGLNRDGSTWSEDSFFFARLRTAGISVYVDHELSLEVGHVSETVIWN